MDFSLSAILQAHSSDVKDVAFISEDLLVSCSRDHSVLVWELSSKSIITHILTHTNYVNAVCSVMNEETPYVVSAGTDKDILVHDVYTGECIQRLKGHTENVCVLASIPGTTNSFISGSWDKTARVWSDGKCIFTLTGHAQSVWGVLALSPTRFITASADKTIKFWAKDECLQTIPAHTDVARALCASHVGASPIVASCGNDGVVKTWSEQGTLLHELHGHTSFVYKVTCTPKTGEWVSCGEDRSVRIWKDAELKQTLTLPIITVWSVAVSPNGMDLAAAGNDGHVYLFTRNSEKVADAETQTLYNTSLSNFAIPKNQVGDFNTEKLPGPEALLAEGQKDGQVIMVKTETSVEAHQWSAADMKWVKIGDVVDAIGSSRKQIYEGVEYDHVFDIDTGSGTFLKLPYNLKENPYEAAHRFLVKNDLDPRTFGEEVANFIIENTKGTTISQGAAHEETFVDPYTGQNRYRSTAAAPSASITTASTAKYNPWATENSQKGTLVPVSQFIAFQQFNFEAIKKKIHELATQFQLSLDVENLEKTSWDSAQKILNHSLWPSESKFPALDLLRWYVLSNADHSKEMVPLILKTVQVEKAEFNALMGFRVIANMFQTPSYRSEVLAQLHSILVQLNDYRISTNKNVRLSIVTVLLNLTVHMHQTGVVLPDTLDILAILVEFLQQETDGETLFRTVTAIGTLCSLGAPMKMYVGPFNLKVFLNQLLDREKEIRTLQAIQECLNLI